MELTAFALVASLETIIVGSDVGAADVQAGRGSGQHLRRRVRDAGGSNMQLTQAKRGSLSYRAAKLMPMAGAGGPQVPGVSQGVCALTHAITCTHQCIFLF